MRIDFNNHIYFARVHKVHFTISTLQNLLERSCIKRTIFFFSSNFPYNTVCTFTTTASHYLNISQHGDEGLIKIFRRAPYIK